jgi:branched-chain amino acid transport system substrate-binding protein
MLKPTKGFLSIATIAALGALAACGTASTSSSGTTATGIAGCKGTITVATDLPLTGGDVTDGPYVQMAAELAVNQAISNKLLGGCTLKYISDNDSTVLADGHSPAQGAINITALASNLTVMGVVGPFNSSVALAEIPVASQNDLALISPSNTNPCLTVVVAVCSDPSIAINTASLYPSAHSYFRVIASDVQQGDIDAYIAASVLNAKKAYVIDDQQAYGRGLALLFSKAYTADGGTIVGSASLPSTTTTYTTQISLAQSEGANMIFFGGTSGDGCGLVRRDMGAGGLNIPMLGGDGCQDTLFITDANSGANKTEAEGSYATSAPDVTKLSSAASFYSDYATAYASVTPPYNNAMNEPYTPYGYDAMNILLQAIHYVLVQNGGQPPTSPATFRAKVVAALHQTNYSGAVGVTTFDTAGDTTNTGFTLYKVESGAWVGDGTYAVSTSGTVSLNNG